MKLRIKSLQVKEKIGHLVQWDNKCEDRIVQPMKDDLYNTNSDDNKSTGAGIMI